GAAHVLHPAREPPLLRGSEQSMMNSIPSWRRLGGALVLATGATLLGACDPKQELLDPQQPGVISPTNVNSATAADAVYVGAIQRAKEGLNGLGGNQDPLWGFEALFTDEVRSGDTFSQRNDADQRNTQSNDTVLLPMYDAVQQAR